MSWQTKYLNIIGTRFVEYNPSINGVCGETLLLDVDGNTHNIKDMPIGTMFSLPEDIDINDDLTEYEWPWFLAKKYKIANYYFAHNSHRRPLFIVLPRRTLFLIDGKCWNNGEMYGGWIVSGDANNVTVEPSINIGGVYHGWLKEGILSADVDGRIYD